MLDVRQWKSEKKTYLILLLLTAVIIPIVLICALWVTSFFDVRKDLNDYYDFNDIGDVKLKIQYLEYSVNIRNLLEIKYTVRETNVSGLGAYTQNVSRPKNPIIWTLFPWRQVSYRFSRQKCH